MCESELPRAAGPNVISEGQDERYGRPSREYVEEFDDQVRLRVCMYIRSGKLMRFAVAVEYRVEDERFVRVVGIDNFHGYAHRHVFRRGGTQVSKPTPMPDSKDTARSLAWAIAHLRRFHQKYVEGYITS